MENRLGKSEVNLFAERKVITRKSSPRKFYENPSDQQILKIPKNKFKNKINE